MLIHKIYLYCKCNKVADKKKKKCRCAMFLLFSITWQQRMFHLLTEFEPPKHHKQFNLKKFSRSHCNL
ncbi:hypothetical protein EUGRSUZ_D00686 [Eucalyptus grandis]|uniref:Uncharacterized protein n=2 Tax=Eucalyptus grandis TaxID=71139 RepID=A0ACC3L3M5_EUCGR|nr:hypothetical protein EUGRSUZ_D00686 [Eucalyptus grandis]